jgi:1-acyl-sn-glycerol-3-phosphate acyltransferase
MDDWELAPARDLGASGMDRYRHPQRESGLVESVVRLGWWVLLRTTFRTWNRLSISGHEQLPAQPPLVLVANHSCHLDAPLLSTLLPLRWRDVTFPIAARDVFFEHRGLAAFSATVVNALPVFRGVSGRHGLADMRERLLRERCVMLLFPEGTRTRTGQMGRFKPGVGMLVAGTEIPVVPCHIHGAYEAMPPGRRFIRPKRIAIRLGAPQQFAELTNDRPGWELCAQRLEQAVVGLAPSQP